MRFRSAPIIIALLSHDGRAIYRAYGQKTSLFEHLLIQLYSGQKHFIDFVIDLRQRKIDFALQV